MIVLTVAGRHVCFGMRFKGDFIGRVNHRTVNHDRGIC